MVKGVDIFGRSLLGHGKLSTDGSNGMKEDLDMGGNKIINCDNPSEDSDLATKYYVDSHRGWNTDGNLLVLMVKLEVQMM